MSDLDDIQFSLKSSAPVQRGAYRAMVRGLHVRIEDDDAQYPVHDISAVGFSMVSPSPLYEVGRILKVRLEIRNRPIVYGIEAKVVRWIPSGLVACSFHSLTRQQEYALDKLVLEIQKRQIAQIAQTRPSE